MFVRVHHQVCVRVCLSVIVTMQCNILSWNTVVLLPWFFLRLLAICFTENRKRCPLILVNWSNRYTFILSNLGWYQNQGASFDKNYQRCREKKHTVQKSTEAIRNDRWYISLLEILCIGCDFVIDWSAIFMGRVNVHILQTNLMLTGKLCTKTCFIISW